MKWHQVIWHDQELHIFSLVDIPGRYGVLLGVQGCMPEWFPSGEAPAVMDIAGRQGDQDEPYYGDYITLIRS